MPKLARVLIAPSLLTRCALLVVFLLSAAAAARPAQVQAGGTFTGTVPGPGALALVVWSGGPAEEITSALTGTSCTPRSVWATRRSGGLVGYLFGAPDAVNSSFRAEFAGAALPAQTPVVLVCAGGSAPAPRPGSEVGTGTVPAGTYEAFIWLPDAADSIRRRPEYAIQLANVDTWEPATGYNALQHRIEIGGAKPGVATLEYGESTKNLLNPERGMVGMYVSTSDSRISANTLRGYRSTDSVNLVRLVFNLKDFREGDVIPEWYLAKMQHELDVIREVGMKAIPRFVYDYAGSDSPNDVPFNRLSAHVDQLAPVVNSNIDVIAAFEVGLIGKYGEWWDSTSYGDERETSTWAARVPVVQKVLDAFHDRPVLLRTPSFLQYMIARGVTPESRLGMHNDAFLAGPTDWNTFPTDKDRQWFEGWSLGRAVGGEHEIQPNVNWTDKDRIANYDDFALQHWSYLNPSFRREVVDLWKRTPHPDGGSYWENVLRHLGYRIKLNSVSLPNSSPVGDDIPIRITLQNVGWAAPFNPRDVVAVLRNTATQVEYHFAISADPREWRGGEVTISGVLRMPD